MAMTVLDHRYDLGVQGRGQIYFISVFRLETRTPLSFIEMFIYLAQLFSRVCKQQRGFKTINVTL